MSAVGAGTSDPDRRLGGGLNCLSEALGFPSAFLVLNMLFSTIIISWFLRILFVAAKWLHVSTNLMGHVYKEYISV